METPVAEISQGIPFDSGEYYKTLLGLEIQNHTIVVTILLGIFVTILGLQWWWNKRGVEETIQKKMDIRLEKEIKEIRRELEDQLEASIILQMDLSRAEINKKLNSLEADIARSMALITYKDKDYEISIAWWARSIKHLLLLDGQRSMRAFTDMMVTCVKRLKTSKKESDSKIEIRGLESIKEVIGDLPDSLYLERDKILKFLEDCIDENSS